METKQLMSQGSSIGRTCNCCGQWHLWHRYNLKSNGRNGYDSRCKSCISKAKQKYKRKRIRNFDEIAILHPVLIGKADKQKIDLVGKILAASIMTLIDVGKIK